jgi:hypothetical protein
MDVPRLCLLLLLLAFSNCAWSQQSAPSAPQPEDRLRTVHEALFSSFLPIAELRTDPRLFELFTEARDGIWPAAGQSERFRQLLSPFADLRSLGTACGVSSLLHGSDVESFAELAPSEREHVLYLLETCDQNGPLRPAITVRNFYVAKTYGSIQQQLTGVHLNLHAPPDWIEQHRARLPPTRLRFDGERREISSMSGPIDYLIVGSGPPGSVLAHELRRGGKNVLLIERGSFVVPGSIETRLVDDLVDSRTSEDGAVIIHNGMAVGGGSQVNVDLCFAPTLPAIQARINGWRREGRIGADDFTKDQLDSAYKWVKAAIGTRTLPSLRSMPTIECCGTERSGRACTRNSTI